MRKIKKIILHCSDSEFGNALLIDFWHKQRGWKGIGYHYVVQNGHPYSKTNTPHKLTFLDGMIEAGRPERNGGAHARGHNKDSLGICMIGKPGEFTHAQLVSVRALILNIQNRYNLSIDDVYGHYEFDLAKTCPGLDMYFFREYIKNHDKLNQLLDKET